MWTGSDVDKPDWVVTEEEYFHKSNDQNKDGHMNREEIKDWMYPQGYDHANAEARHLISESDNNKVYVNRLYREMH